jgi:hypothetical protein
MSPWLLAMVTSNCPRKRHASKYLIPLLVSVAQDATEPHQRRHRDKVNPTAAPWTISLAIPREPRSCPSVR